MSKLQAKNILNPASVEEESGPVTAIAKGEARPIDKKHRHLSDSAIEPDPITNRVVGQQIE